ncbi:uncharacterized protein LOC143041483 isoform X2 [Oratosquilla oratoria]|uniref:uncharacterized protein LOC143041483 isoform X2 n=1 Tax=Oratosquilla oratoria TaxID=337810 RepID=UPI003F763CF9
MTSVTVDIHLPIRGKKRMLFGTSKLRMLRHIPFGKCHGRRMMGTVFFMLATFGIYHFTTVTTVVDITDRVYISPSHLACQIPELSVKNPEIYHLFHPVDPLRCEPEADWVQVEGSVATITRQARKKHGGDIECAFTEIIRVDDDTSRNGLTTTTHDSFTFVNTDFYKVSCEAKDGEKWENVIAGIRQDEEVMEKTGWSKVPKEGLGVNMIVFVFDSLSRNTFIRTLPRSYEYLTETLGAHILESYNIVGDGTPQAIIPILTGKNELELPESRRRMGNSAQYVNNFPFVWHEYAKSGYVTLFAEDQPHIGTFNLRLRGFDSQPTDHYMRPFYQEIFPTYGDNPKYCLKGTPRHRIFLDYLRNYMTVYKDKPKFAFALHAELSHDDYNLINVADDDFHDFLQFLKEDGHLDNTVLAVMSDHGHRFTAVRKTQQGKQEERLPFVSITIPPMLNKKVPTAVVNVRLNSRRLVTPFDMNPTLLDIVKFSGARLGQVTDRGISLFSEIPPSRTCSDAFIEPHWCACLTWEKVSTKEERVKQAGKAIVHYINTYTAPQRSLCLEISLHKINWASKLLPNKGLLSFKKNADIDGFVPDMSGETNITQEVYQLQITTNPGEAHFEASLTYNLHQDSFSVKIDDISRTNKYGNQPHCVVKSFVHLLKFCYCREPPPRPIVQEP